MGKQEISRREFVRRSTEAGIALAAAPFFLESGRAGAAMQTVAASDRSNEAGGGSMIGVRHLWYRSLQSSGCDGEPVQSDGTQISLAVDVLSGVGRYGETGTCVPAVRNTH